MTVDAAALFRTSPFHQWLDCEIERMDEDEVVLTLRFREEFVGDPEHPTYHGGVLAALIDAAGTFALIAATGRDWITVDMRVDYRRAAGPGAVTARAVPVRTGRTLGLADVTLTDRDGKAVTSGRLTLAAARDSVAAETEKEGER